jgi:hypothetical protein
VESALQVLLVLVAIAIPMSFGIWLTVRAWPQLQRRFGLSDWATKSKPRSQSRKDNS